MDQRQGEYILQERFGTIKRAAAFYDNQVLDRLNLLMKEFIRNQTMVFISTSDKAGNCDASFRAGARGFVRVLDDSTLMYPEYRGNGVMASLGNILENAHIGLLFMDFTDNQIGLHVNGEAAIYENNLLPSLSISEEVLKNIKMVEGNKPERWVVIKVEEAYIHCSKHIPKLRKVDKEIDWGTDDEKSKGGDFFKAKQNRKK